MFSKQSGGIRRRSFTQSLALACVTASGLTAQYAAVKSPVSFLNGTFDWHVDSANGSDSYDGKWPVFTSGTHGPFATIGKLLQQTITTGQRIGLACGSYWKEQLALPFAVSNLTVEAYGDYASPQNIPSTAWSFSGTTNVYQMSLPFSCVTWGGSGKFIMMTEDAARPCGLDGQTNGAIHLLPMMSVALCASNPGSYYVSGATLYVHAYDDSDPGANNYKYTWRNPPMLDGANQIPTSGWTLCNGLSKTYFRNVSNIAAGAIPARECNAWESGSRMGYANRALLSATMTSGVGTMTVGTTSWVVGDLLFVGSEQLVITSDASSGTFSVSRAQNGTIAASHSVNDYVVNATKTDATSNVAALAGPFGSTVTSSFIVHASDDSNPNVSGKIYEYTARDFGFDSYDAPYSTVRGIAVQKSYANDGSMHIGLFGNAEWCVWLHGGKHNAYVRPGSKVTNCAGLEYYYGGNATIGIVFNEDYPTFEGVTFDHFQMRSSNVWVQGFLDTAIDGHSNQGATTSLSTNTIASSGNKTFTLAQAKLGYKAGQTIRVVAETANAAASNVPIATGNQTFTLNATTYTFVAGDRLRAYSKRIDSNAVYLEGVVVSYSGTTLVLAVDTAVGAGVLNDGTLTGWSVTRGYMDGTIVSYTGNTMVFSPTSSVLSGTYSSWAFSTGFGVVACNFCYVEHAGGAIGFGVTSLNCTNTLNCITDVSAQGTVSIVGGIFDNATSGVGFAMQNTPTVYNMSKVTIKSTRGGSQALISVASNQGCVLNADRCSFQDNSGVTNFQRIFQVGLYSAINITNTTMISPHGLYYDAVAGVALNSDNNVFSPPTATNGWKWWDGSAVQTYSSLAAYSAASRQDTHSH